MTVVALYYGVSICLVSFASTLAVVTLNIHHRGYRGDEVPKTVKSVILGYMARALFLHFDPTQHTNSRTGDNNTVDTNHKNTTNNLNLKKLNVSQLNTAGLAIRNPVQIPDFSVWKKKMKLKVFNSIIYFSSTMFR